MNLDIIESRLKNYAAKTKQEEVNAFKEICQEIALSGLARSHFFKIGAFQGGTCLRILYGLDRFSEDLDFILHNPNINFDWEEYLKIILLEFESFGISLEIINRTQADSVLQRAFLKSNSFGKILHLKHASYKGKEQVVKIKLEIDINPPEGSIFETKYLDYPYPFSILVQNPPTLFASKCHALLCRPFVKGRDWYDFLWYIQRKTTINFEFLTKALQQIGPYKNEKKSMDSNWLFSSLTEKIKTINWEMVKNDVHPFLKMENLRNINEWSQELFLSMLQKLKSYL